MLSYSVYFKGPQQLWNHWVRQYLVDFTGLVGIVNATVYKIEPIFTGLGHGWIQYNYFLRVYKM